MGFGKAPSLTSGDRQPCQINKIAANEYKLERIRVEFLRTRVQPHALSEVCEGRDKAQEEGALRLGNR
jgi:hypothetical protein